MTVPQEKRMPVNVGEPHRSRQGPVPVAAPTGAPLRQSSFPKKRLAPQQKPTRLKIVHWIGIEIRLYFQSRARRFS